VGSIVSSRIEDFAGDSSVGGIKIGYTFDLAIAIDLAGSNIVEAN
jgi:hypothetical protein